jgi:hypothetical protein
MIPLNIYLQEASPEQMAHAVVEYGNAIKDLVAANIFPGDMLWKNFGITRHGKVVFYDYDEIEYITDCNFRRVPEPRNEEEEMSGEVWYTVGPKDVFPETFGPFLLGNAQVREVFMAHHADLLDAAFWQGHKNASRPVTCTTSFPTSRPNVSATARRGDCPPPGPPRSLPCPTPSSSCPPPARPSAACWATLPTWPPGNWAPWPSRPPSRALACRAMRWTKCCWATA